MVYLRETLDEVALVHVARAAHEPVVLDPRHLAGIESGSPALRTCSQGRQACCHTERLGAGRQHLDVAAHRRRSTARATKGEVT